MHVLESLPGIEPKVVMFDVDRGRRATRWPLVTRDAPADLDDAGFGRVLAVGAAFGLPMMFGVSLLIALFAGVPLSGAPLIAAWGAVVGGPFFGGLFVLTKVLAKVELLRPGIMLAEVPTRDVQVARVPGGIQAGTVGAGGDACGGLSKLV